jgi:hypothetical protein
MTSAAGRKKKTNTTELNSIASRLHGGHPADNRDDHIALAMLIALLGGPGKI